MSSDKQEVHKDLKALGSATTEYDYSSADAAILERFPNPTPEITKSMGRATVKIVQPEFTSLCLVGDTLIDIATDEIDNPKGVAIKDLIGTEGFVFSFDEHKGVPVARRYSDVRMTNDSNECVTVVYDLFKGPAHDRRLERMNITCTLTHPFLVRKGWGVYEWVEAQNLTVRDQLVADQRATDTLRGHSRHRLIAEALNDRELTQDEVAHHVDHNHYNNEPSNIAVMTNKDHLSHHQNARYGYENLDVSALAVDRIAVECNELYNEGYTSYELAKYYDVHETTISQWIRRAGGKTRTSLQTKVLRKEMELPPLNHRVVSVEPAGNHTVYNMEVEDTECFFANGVVVHNCPMTGQPDFATIVIEYEPRDFCVESKSIKMYLGSFRQARDFHESCVAKIFNDLKELLDPKYLMVEGQFTPRGGIPFWPKIEWRDESLPTLKVDKG